MIFTEHLLNAGIRPKTSNRATKSPCNRATALKNRKESGQALSPWEGMVNVESFLHTGKSALQPRHWHWGEQGLGAGAWASEVRPRRGLGLAMWGQPEGLGCGHHN